MTEKHKKPPVFRFSWKTRVLSLFLLTKWICSHTLSGAFPAPWTFPRAKTVHRTVFAPVYGLVPPFHVPQTKKKTDIRRCPFLFGGRGGTWIRKFSYYPLLKFVIFHCFIWFFKLYVLFCVIVFPLELSSKGKYKGKLLVKISPYSRYIYVKSSFSLTTRSGN